MSSGKTDDLEAVRAVVSAVEPFTEPTDRKRIFRWAAEKLGLPEPFASPPAASSHTSHSHPSAPASHQVPTSLPPQPPTVVQDIRSFVEAKKPKSDIQFAAVVAYFHQFVAREGERKEAIDKEILKDAFRKAQRKIPKDCGFTLVNALNAGVLDRKDGKFSVNSVGENLVAMTLPGDATTPLVTKVRKKPRKAAQKTGAKNRSK